MILQREQENLNLQQKEALIPRVLTTNNPQAPHNKAVYSYKERGFKRDDLVDQLVIHFAMDGNILLKDTEEARDQEEFKDEKKQMNEQLIKKFNEGIIDEGGNPRKEG